jgi:predicted 2-oxoglutarate/Fe(II)-dependent dioxygenase YbiX
MSQVHEDMWVAHTWHTYSAVSNGKPHDKELKVYNPTFQHILKSWRGYLNKALVEYQQQVDHHFSLYFLSDVRYNKYETGTLMLSHDDHIRSLFDGHKKGIPILSLVASMNDKEEYTGGDFVFKNIDKRYRLKKGQILVFPSVFVYNHNVEEVTSGTRYTSVCWSF